MQHPDEGQIHAWLDGALDAEESTALETHARECSECAAAVAEARGLIAGASRILSTLDDVPHVAAPIAKRRPWVTSQVLRIAAMVMFAAALGTAVTRYMNRGDMSVMSEATAVSSKSVVAETVAPEIGVESASANVGPAATDLAASKPLPKGQAGQTQTAQAQAAPGQSSPRQTALDQSAPIAYAATQAGSAPPSQIAQRAANTGAIAGAVNADQAEVPRMGASSAEANAASARSAMRIVSVDSTGGGRRTEIQVRPGVTVTLAEAIQPARGTAAGSRMRTSSSAAPTAPAPAAVAESNVGVNQIQWIDSGSGKMFTLSGRLSVAELTALRPGIEALRANVTPKR